MEGDSLLGTTISPSHTVETKKCNFIVLQFNGKKKILQKSKSHKFVDAIMVMKKYYNGLMSF